MNNVMKATALTSSMALMAPTAFADGFQLSEKLSVSGFIDMSTVYMDPDGGASSSSSGLDQFELDFLFQFDDNLSAQADLEYHDDGSGQLTDIEQAFFTYSLSEGLSVKAGRFLSYSGWETEEPTGLYQYSGTGYAGLFYGGYQQGASVHYGTDMFHAALSIINSVGDLVGTDTDSTNLGTELMLAVMPFDGLTAKIFFISEQETDLVNLWASYAINGLTLAVEVNSSENAGGAAEADGYLLMANYAWEQFGITFRLHEFETENSAGTTTLEASGITIAPSVQVSDNLLIVTEYRMDEDDISGAEMDTVAVEALITF